MCMPYIIISVCALLPGKLPLGQRASRILPFLVHPLGLLAYLTLSY